MNTKHEKKGKPHFSFSQKPKTEKMKKQIEKIDNTLEYFFY